jgi:hypothetical protein
MHRFVRKHYSELATFVELGNLASKELSRYGEFPELQNLQPGTKHAELLDRVERAFNRKFAALRPSSEVPPLIFPRWSEHSIPVRRQLHIYALVRRIFDSLQFLIDAVNLRLPAAHSSFISLQVGAAESGEVARVHDKYEDFLTAIEGRDLRRLRVCPVCNRFFVAMRFDQKACRPECANNLRVRKFRKKQPEYVKNRRFRKKMGIPALHKGRKKMIDFHDILTRPR